MCEPPILRYQNFALSTWHCLELKKACLAVTRLVICLTKYLSNHCLVAQAFTQHTLAALNHRFMGNTLDAESTCIDSQQWVGYVRTHSWNVCRSMR